MSDLPTDYPDKFYYYGMHKSFGLVALLFVIFRLSVRMRAAVPKLPAKISNRDANIAALTVGLLYFAMLAMPLSGFLMSDFGDYTVSFFGVELPGFFDKNLQMSGFFRSSHGYIAYALIVVISLHVLGSIKHLLVEKVNIFKRMW